MKKLSLLLDLKKKPQDFILSNRKCLSAKQMLIFAFNYFDMNYKRYIFKDKKFLRPVEIRVKQSKFRECLIINKIKKKNYTYGKKMINLIIKYYLKESGNNFKKI